MRQRFGKKSRPLAVVRREIPYPLAVGQVEATVAGHQKLAPHGSFLLKKPDPVPGFGQALGGQQAGRPAADNGDVGSG